MKTPQEIIDLVGGSQSAAAKALGVTPQAVNNWLARGSVPLAHTAKIIAIARSKGVKMNYKDLLE
mgnify:FL=1|jgi:DNA-binding transcriptional regulator YdaS (Cro superfamily)|tara:strand:+ start:122 stop:316 length:195 start_codon:yes stop_codon:yes gene_type:complete